MTDDERMDRAERIREMRAGSRSTDDEQATDSPGEPEREPGSGEQGGAESTDETATGAADGTGFEFGDGPTAGTGDEDATGAGSPDAADVDLPDAADLSDAVDQVTGADAETQADAEAAADAGAADSADEDDGTVHVSSAAAGDVDVDVEEMARQAGLESAGADLAEGPGEGDGLEGIGPGSVAGTDTAETESKAETRVLEFGLGDEQYCLDIEYVEEIVKRETVTRVPNTPDCVEGVVDLRGQITTILDPKVLLDIDQEGTKDLIVVFDPEQFDDHGAVGWVVDDVDRVTPVTEDEVNSSPVEQEHVNGVVDRDGEFVIWTTPELDVDELAG